MCLIDVNDNRMLRPEGGVPYIGHLANDCRSPRGSRRRKPSGYLAPAPREGDGESSRYRRFGLYTAREVRSREEILWDYGESYQRSWEWK